MQDNDRTKQQLIDELIDLRQQVTELEAQVGQYEQVRRSLQESEELYRTLFEKAQLGIGVADIQGNLMTFNDAMLEPGGYSREDITRIRNVALLYYDASERDRILGIARKQGFVHRTEVQFKRKDGMPYDTLLSLTPVHINDQHYWLAMVEDVTERKQVEAALRLSEQRYRMLAQNFPNSAVMLLDHDLRFVLIDGPEIETTGFSKALLEGRTIYETLPPEFVQMVEPNIRAALAGEFFSAELPWENDTFYLYSYVPLKDEKGEVVLAMILAQNITRLKETERKLVEIAVQRERIQVLEELIDDLSHDIKTPLSSINTLLYLLKKRPEPSIQEQYLERLESQVWQLDKLVGGILLMAQLDNNLELAAVPLRVASLLEHITNMHLGLMEKKRITFVHDIDSDLPLIHGNELELRRVLDNLITNAVTYTPDEGLISIHAYAEHDHVIIEVTDTGIGIAKSEIPLIFERFYRVDKSRNSNQGGTGLGLAIVRKIAERHNGRIEVQSTPGEGSTFRLCLPVSAEK